MCFPRVILIRRQAEKNPRSTPCIYIAETAMHALPAWGIKPQLVATVNSQLELTVGSSSGKAHGHPALRD